MGMFDYVDNITVYCPKCGNVITNNFQTKDFVAPFLEHYSPGDEIPTDRDDEDYIEIHSICEECELFTGVYLKVVGNTLTNEII
jgi:hypothetical protein